MRSPRRVARARCAGSRASARRARRRSSPRSRSAVMPGTRALHMDAEEHALSIAQHLRADPAALRVEIAGPVRRWLEIVDHLAFAVATEQPDAIVERFRSYALVTGVEHGEQKISARLADGMKCEVHLAPPRAVRLGADLRDRLARARRAAARAGRRHAARRRGRGLRAARRAVRAAGGPRRRRRARHRLERPRHRARRHDRLALPHDVQRRPPHDPRDGRGRRRAWLRRRSRSPITRRPRATPAASMPRSCARSTPRSRRSPRRSGSSRAPKPTSSPTARSTCRWTSSPISTS